MNKFLETLKVDISQFIRILSFIENNSGHMFIENGKDSLHFHSLKIDKENFVMYLENIEAFGPRFFNSDIEEGARDMVLDALISFNGDSFYKKI